MLDHSNLRSRFTALGEHKIIALFSVSMVRTVGLMPRSNGRQRLRIRSMAVLSILDLARAGTGRAFPVEGIRRSRRAPVTATVGRMLGASQGALRQVRTCKGGFGMMSQRHLKRAFGFEMPYAVKDRGNPLKSQQMRPPSDCSMCFWQTDRVQPIDERDEGAIWGPVPVRTRRKNHNGSIALRAAFCPNAP
jgi:hypothetical protein